MKQILGNSEHAHFPELRTVFGNENRPLRHGSEMRGEGGGAAPGGEIEGVSGAQFSRAPFESSPSSSPDGKGGKKNRPPKSKTWTSTCLVVIQPALVGLRRTNVFPSLYP